MAKSIAPKESTSARASACLGSQLLIATEQACFCPVGSKEGRAARGPFPMCTDCYCHRSIAASMCNTIADSANTCWTSEKRHISGSGFGQRNVQMANCIAYSATHVQNLTTHSGGIHNGSS